MKQACGAEFLLVRVFFWLSVVSFSFCVLVTENAEVLSPKNCRFIDLTMVQKLRVGARVQPRSRKDIRSGNIIHPAGHREWFVKWDGTLEPEKMKSGQLTAISSETATDVQEPPIDDASGTDDGSEDTNWADRFAGYHREEESDEDIDEDYEAGIAVEYISPIIFKSPVSLTSITSLGNMIWRWRRRGWSGTTLGSGSSPRYLVFALWTRGRPFVMVFQQKVR